MKKDFFREATLAQILNKDPVIYEAGGLNITSLDVLAFTNWFAIIPAPLPGNQNIQNNYLKHGPELKLPRSYTRLEALGSNSPQEIRVQTLENIPEDIIPCCYSFKPYFGNDTKTRRISLTTCLEGTRLFCMSEQVKGEKIKVKPYDKAKIIEKEGAQIRVEVPSREVGKSPYEFMFSFVPVKDTEEKKVIWLELNSNHTCNYKTFRELKYNSQGSKEFSKTMDFCPHEVAGYLAIIDYYFNQDKRNFIPLQMSPFVIPSLSTVKFNVALRNNVVLHDPTSKTDGNFRKPKQGDYEKLNWIRLKLIEDYKETFFASNKRDGKIKDYRWN